LVLLCDLLLKVPSLSCGPSPFFKWRKQQQQGTYDVSNMKESNGNSEHDNTHKIDCWDGLYDNRD
jgi:hypothetical protein